MAVLIVKSFTGNNVLECTYAEIVGGPRIKKEHNLHYRLCPKTLPAFVEMASLRLLISRKMGYPRGFAGIGTGID